jgi:hypothetical protein
VRGGSRESTGYLVGYLQTARRPQDLTQKDSLPNTFLAPKKLA